MGQQAERTAAELALRVHHPARERPAFRLQRLEPHVGYALAALTAWSAVFLHPASGLPWAVALLAAAVGAWARTYPAQRQAKMFARAVLLQVAGWLLLTAPGFGGPGGPALLFLLGLGFGYGMLLSVRWSVPLGALGLVAYVEAAFGGESALAWQQAMALAGGLCAVPALGLVMGRSFRISERTMEQARVDPGTRLYNEAGFFANGSELFDECRREQRPFTLVLLRAADLQDATEVLGRKAANELFAQAVKGISAATPAGGIAARTDIAEFAVAMPGQTVERAEALVHQRLGRPLHVKVRVANAEAMLVLDAVSAQAPSEMHTLEELYDRLHLELRRRAGQEPPTEPATLGGMPSTLHGLLLQDPPMPSDQRPTLPMNLPHLSARRGRDAARAAAHAR
jgi:GGDEF domain-containing protein